MPAKAKTLRFLVTADNGSLWLGGREGVFYSEDHGQSWTQLSSLPFNDVDGLDFNQEYKRLMVTSANGTLMMAIDPVKKDWKLVGHWLERSHRPFLGRAFGRCVHV